MLEENPRLENHSLEFLGSEGGSARQEGVVGSEATLGDYLGGSWPELTEVGESGPWPGRGEGGVRPCVRKLEGGSESLRWAWEGGRAGRGAEKGAELGRGWGWAPSCCQRPYVPRVLLSLSCRPPPSSLPEGARRQGQAGSGWAGHQVSSTVPPSPQISPVL